MWYIKGTESHGVSFPMSIPFKVMITVLTFIVSALMPYREKMEMKCKGFNPLMQ